MGCRGNLTLQALDFPLFLLTVRFQVGGNPTAMSDGDIRLGGMLSPVNILRCITRYAGKMKRGRS